MKKLKYIHIQYNISLKKDKHSDMCPNMDEPSGHYILSEISESQRDEFCMILLI